MMAFTSCTTSWLIINLMFVTNLYVSGEDEFTRSELETLREDVDIIKKLNKKQESTIEKQAQLIESLVDRIESLEAPEQVNLKRDFSNLSLEDVDSVSEADRDTLAPLPPPQWNSQYPYGGGYLPPNMNYVVPPYSYTSTDSQSFVGSFVDGADSRLGGFPPGSSIAGGGGNNSTGSVHSGSGVASKNDCACIMSTYNKFTRLWENKEKQEYHDKQLQSNKNTNSSSQNGNQLPMNNFHSHMANNTYSQLGMTAYPTHLPMHITQDMRDSSSCSGSSASGSSKKEKKKSSPVGSGGSDTETMASSALDPNENQPRPGLGVPQDVSASRQSFRMAMGNPCDSVMDL